MEGRRDVRCHVWREQMSEKYAASQHLFEKPHSIVEEDAIAEETEEKVHELAIRHHPLPHFGRLGP